MIKCYGVKLTARQAAAMLAAEAIGQAEMWMDSSTVGINIAENVTEKEIAKISCEYAKVQQRLIKIYQLKAWLPQFYGEEEGRRYSYDNS